MTWGSSSLTNVVCCDSDTDSTACQSYERSEYLMQDKQYLLYDTAAVDLQRQRQDVAFECGGQERLLSRRSELEKLLDDLS